MVRRLVLLPLLALAACGSSVEREKVVPQDPAMSEAIEGQLLVDPDLTQQNLRNLAIANPGPVDPALPLPDPPAR